MRKPHDKARKKKQSTSKAKRTRKREMFIEDLKSNRGLTVGTVTYIPGTTKTVCHVKLDGKIVFTTKLVAPGVASGLGSKWLNRLYKQRSRFAKEK